ncbi:MAG: hypothetical protein IIV61_03405 [Oscillospiraceae bacterium]|nr:hypothetical protein [Oscillospiraceae bacterium]MBQ5711639.1 hypothetical protein [Oscillospiraceae bacterium]
MKMARTQNAFRNTIWGVVYRIVALIGPFAIKTIIIKKIGMEYSGLNTLFNSILTVLNLANLGFSSSLVYTMYDAVAREDHEAICAMLNFFRKVYRIIGFVILGMGIAVMPFLPQLVGDECPPDANLYVMFSLYLSATVLDYILFGYINAIFSAYQREDSRLKIMTVRYVVQYVLQIVILAVFENYYAYLVTLPLMVIPNSLANYHVAKKQFPQISCVGMPSEETKKAIYYRVKTLFAHKVGYTIVINSDSILLSAILGLSIQSLYSNYYYILSSVCALVEIITTGCLAGIGNKLIVDTKDENHRTFLDLSYGWVALIGFCATSMLCLYQPFIGGIWIGEHGLLDQCAVVLMAMLFYFWMFRVMQSTYRDAAGLWTKDWPKPLIAMVIKLALSIPLLYGTQHVGGVLLPTILIQLLLYFPWEVHLLYHHVFDRGPWHYVSRMAWYTVLTLASGALCYGCCMALAPGNSVVTFLARLGIVCVIFPAVWICATYRSAEFKGMWKLATRILGKFIPGHK